MLLKAKEPKTIARSLLISSILGEGVTYNEVGEAHPRDWLVLTSGAGALAEERAQNKDKFNVLREVEQVAVDAETSARAAAFNDIEGE